MTDRPLNSALVVEGGAMRGIFSTGILDGFLERQFNPFHCYFGVSAGASSLAGYLAEMPGRNRTVYTEYSTRPEFINVARFLRGGHLIELDWLWDLTISRMRLDLRTIYAGGRPFIVGLTQVSSGRPVYRETSADDLEHVLKASSALPVFYRGFPLVNGEPMTDGGVADPIPVAEAIRRGARRIMVIRSRPCRLHRKRDLSSYLISWFLHGYPALKAAVRNQNEVYNRTVSLIQHPPAGVSIVEICPPSDFQVDRFCRDTRQLVQGYELGRALAPEAIARWEAA